MQREILFARPFIEDEDINAIIEVLKSGWLSTGPKVKEFEKEFAHYIGAKYAVAVNSCTAALHLALEGYNIGQGDEVITTPYTFVSTSEVILYTGAKPVFVDIEPDGFNIDPNNIEKAITKKTKAIIPVHIAGEPCELDEILDIANRYNLVVIDDAAHALPAKYKGKMIGTMCDATCFSFYATKNLATGEGGMLTTSSQGVAQKVEILRLHGMSREAWRRYSDAQASWYYEILDKGYKYNMGDIQAAMGLVQLRKLAKMQALRKKIVEIYNKELEDLNEFVILPQERPGKEHAWHLYIIRLVQKNLKITRDEFINKLKEYGINTSVHFIPLHLMPYYRKTFGFKKGDFPNAEKTYESAVSLPLYPSLSEDDAEYVAKSVRKILIEHRK